MTKGSHHRSCQKNGDGANGQGQFKAKLREYKRLTAQEIHGLVSEVLQEHFPLDIEGRTYRAADICDVLIAAAVERLTVEGATENLDNLNNPNRF